MKIPVLLLKTRSQPDDTYEEYFSTTSSQANPPVSFHPVFVPVLEHTQDEERLGSLGDLLKNGELKDKYGGMIFTSQRAVEGWADTVWRVERELHEEQVGGQRSDSGAGYSALEDSSKVGDLKKQVNMTNVETAIDTRTNRPFMTDISFSTPFPLYTVGPATSRALNTLVVDCASKPDSLFTSLNPEILGAHTGNGANLAKYMLNHYNTLQEHRYFTFYEAPRLPFIPLLGMGSENYSRKRLEESDSRLQKKPLLFLVGEQRRDIIPKSLMNPALGKEKIEVEEVEVYSTIVKEGFQDSLTNIISQYTSSTPSMATASTPPEKKDTVIIIIFSPQGSDTMLRTLGYIDSENKLTKKGHDHTHNRKSLSAGSPLVSASEPSSHQGTATPENENEKKDESGIDEQRTKYIIATIGPTTRDHLINSFGFKPDICAGKPSPEGLMEGIDAYIREYGIGLRASQ